MAEITGYVQPKISRRWQERSGPWRYHGPRRGWRRAKVWTGDTIPACGDSAAHLPHSIRTTHRYFGCPTSEICMGAGHSIVPHDYDSEPGGMVIVMGQAWPPNWEACL